MATDLGRTKPAPAGKYETVVEERITQARRRIRVLDVALALLGITAAALGYGLVLALCDRAWELPLGFRLTAFVLFAAAGLSYLLFALVLPLRRQVSARFAARELERTLPGAKNSVINWLDLHDENLPPAIKTALTRQAAKDLARADLQQAVSARPAAWLGGIAAGLLLLLGLFYCFVPGQFWSLMGRAYAPFLEGNIARETRLTVLSPRGGDGTVPENRPATIVVEVDGRVPPAASWKGPLSLGVRLGADGKIVGLDNVPSGINPRGLMLHLAYAAGGPYTQYPLEPDGDNRWKVTVPANLVLNGFYYRITGGDAQTSEYHIRAESPPAVDTDRSEVQYHYPSWRGGEETKKDFNLKAVRGTQALLVVRTNRPLREGSLEVEVAGEKRTVPGEVRASEPDTLRVPLTLDFNGGYRIRFTSRTGEVYDGPFRYNIEVIPYSTFTYHYRPYLEVKDETASVSHLPDVKVMRGTEIAWTYHANQKVKAGKLELRQGPKTIVLEGQTDRKDPGALGFKYDKDGKPFVVDRDGSYRLSFVNQDGTVIRDPRTYKIEAMRDSPPRVVLKKPGKEIDLPANGILQLEGEVTDDRGIKDVTLRMQVFPDQAAVQAPTVLEPKPYRPGKPLKTGLGKYPLQLDYKDFVDLGRVRTDKKEPFTLKPGMVVEYWLEATDNCDYPDPKGQVGKSESFRVNIRPPEKEQKRQQDRAQAQKEQQQHDRKQDDKLANQKDQPPPVAQKPNPRPEQQPKPGEKGGQPQPKNQQQANNQGNKEGNPKPENKAGGQNDKERKDLENTRNKLEQALKDQEKNRKNQGSKTQPNNKENSNGNGEPKKGQRTGTQNRNGGDPQAQNATPQDVKDLQNQLQNGGKKEKEEAARKLSNIADQAKDPEAKKAAQNALNKAGQGDNQPNQQERDPQAEKAKPQDVKDLQNQLQNGNQKEKEEAARKLSNIANQAKDPEAKKAAQDALNKAGQGEQRPNNQEQNPKAEQATRQDVNNLQKQMRNGDKQKQDQAANDLKDIARNAKDPDVRKAAQEALKKSGREDTQPKENGNNQGDPKSQKATAQDVKDLQNQLQSGDKQQQEQAAKDLKNIANQAKDPSVRQAAQKALQDANRGNDQPQPDPQAQKATPQDVKNLEKKLQSGDKKEQEQAAQQLANIANQAQDKEARKAAEKALEKAGPKKEGANQNQGNTGTERDPKAEKATPQDVNNLAKQLQQGGSKEEKDQAAKQLENIANQAQDKQAREAAKNALDKAGRKPTPREGSNPKEQGPPKSGKDSTLKDVQAKEKQMHQGGSKAGREQAKKDLERMAQEAKDPKVRQAAQEALKKGDGSKEGSNTEQGGGKKEGDPKAEKATPQDVNNLAKQLQSNDPKEREQAKRELQKIAEQAKDDKARRDAQNALDKAGPEKEGPNPKEGNTGQERDPKAEKATPQDVNDLAKQLQQGASQQQKDQAAEQLQNIANQAQNKQAREAAKNALKKAGREPGKGTQGKTGREKPTRAEPGKEPRAGNQGKIPSEGKGPNTAQERPGNKGTDTDPTGRKPDAASAREATDLNLENLRDKLQKMSPEERQKLLKKANLSPKDYEEWAKKVEEYAKKWKKASEKNGKRPSFPKGGRLPNTGPKKAGPRGPTGTDAETQKVIHPPEYKAALERLTQGGGD